MELYDSKPFYNPQGLSFDPEQTENQRKKKVFKIRFFEPEP
jgi:hypothetical protein